MKILYTIFLLVLAFNGLGQKIRFTDKRNHWVTQGGGADCLFFTRYYYYDTSDSSIHGINYQHIVNYNYCNPYTCSAFDFEDLGGYYIREDTLTNKVYYLNISNSGPDTFEHILYDYNLNVGDTMRYDFIGEHIVDSVTSISSVIISGVAHKVIYMQNEYSYGEAYYTIVEGLGCTAGPILPTYFISYFEYSEQIACFSQNTYYPGITVPFQDVCFGVYDTFNNASSYLKLSSNIINKQPVAFSINPNPASDHIAITVAGKYNFTVFISVYDITGKRVFYSQEKPQNEITINTSSWSNGLYIVIIQSDAGILKKEKVIINQ